MNPSYFVLAQGPKTGKKVRIPVYNVPELETTVLTSAKNIAASLRFYGWSKVKVEAAA